MRLGEPTAGLQETDLERVSLEGDTLEAYQSFWDRSARVDAVHAIADQADAESWVSSGRFDVEAGLDPLLEPGSRVLEIGCGIGRVLQHLPHRCREVHGLDISSEMVAQARERLAGHPNVHIHQGNGYDLGNFDDASLDLVFSVFVFQHMPKTTAYNYVTEVHRVLRPGGRFRFQVPNLLLPEHFHAFHHFTQPHFVDHPYPMNFYTPQEVAKLMLMAGFWVDSVSPHIVVVATKAERRGLAPEVERHLRMRSYELTGDPPPPQTWRQRAVRRLLRSLQENHTPR